MADINGTTVQKLTAYINGTSYPTLAEYANKDGYGTTIVASRYWDTTQPLGSMSLVNGGLVPTTTGVNLGSAASRFGTVYANVINGDRLLVSGGNDWGMGYYSSPVFIANQIQSSYWADGINLAGTSSASTFNTSYWLRPVLTAYSTSNASDVAYTRFIEYSSAIYTYGHTDGEGHHFGRAELQGNLMVVYDLVFGSCAYLYSQAINFD